MSCDDWENNDSWGLFGRKIYALIVQPMAQLASGCGALVIDYLVFCEVKSLLLFTPHSYQIIYVIRYLLKYTVVTMFTFLTRRVRLSHSVSRFFLSVMILPNIGG